MTNLKLFKVSQDVNNDYDTYSDFIVAAASEEEARNTHPNGHPLGNPLTKLWETCDWAPLEDIKIEYIGEAAPHITTNTVLCASFNAG